MMPPIIERELLVALRRKHVRWHRLIAATLAISATVALLLIPSSRNPQKAGQETFQLLFWIGCILPVIETLRVTADLFASERRNNTLGLLFLSGLSASEIFVSKLGSGALMALNSLLALVPGFAVTFLVGGVSLPTFAAAACCLPSLLLFALAMSVLGSTLCEDESAAIVAAVVAGLVVCLAGPAIYAGIGLTAAVGPVSRLWLLVSPAYGPALVSQTFTSASWADSWTNSVATFVWSLAALGLAARVMGRTWQDRTYPIVEAGWRERVRLWVRGSYKWRLRLRRRWLDANPFLWLALHDRTAVKGAWVLLFATSVAWLLVLLVAGKPWLNIPNFLVTAALLQSIVIWMAIYAAAHRLGEDRRSGALELLLTTPLSVEEIVEGQRRAIVVQFKPVWGFLALPLLAFFVTGLGLRSWDWPALAVYAIVWPTLILWVTLLFEAAVWEAMWIGLNSGRPGYAALKTLLGPWMFIPAFMIAVNLPKLSGLGGVLAGFPNGTILEIVIVILLLLIPTLFLAFSQESRRRAMQLCEELRALAQEPVPEPTDPRFAKWDTRYRFPIPGR